MNDAAKFIAKVNTSKKRTLEFDELRKLQHSDAGLGMMPGRLVQYADSFK